MKNILMNTKVGATLLNESSSRSHAIIILTIKNIQTNGYGKFHLIDLAGSEGINFIKWLFTHVKIDNRKTGNTGVRLTESSNINTSLFSLRKVVTALNNGDLRIPYRGSIFTFYSNHLYRFKIDKIVTRFSWWNE